ncbi:hypothetical protein [Shewanella morhuae]|uniref:Uncharacterized protein n=1 Tax=Shewanella morhuae TaxID=365591 RepID=A0A380BVT8_9GAMM|nr:hypothetical protein [Shewanella morhuae]SUJ07977.1 Uncharacterised protein [Shewanella morhuae]
MIIPTLSENAHLALAKLAGGSRVTRVHTQWKPGNSLTNVVTYGIRDKQTVMHILRTGRECVAFEVKQLESYSMSLAIQQAREILDEV